MSFVFATCRAGSEATLKKDVAHRHATRLTPAFMRPQLITWKSSSDLPDNFRLQSPFARVAGISIGRCQNDEELVTKICGLHRRSICLHVFPRETPEDGVPAETWAAIDARREKIVAALAAAGVSIQTSPAQGETVIDVIMDAEEESLFTGLHHHHDGAHATPGGLPRIALPAHAPSRAWLKLEQALIWRGWDQIDCKGQVALDLGCAPGGAALALLDRGMRVIGVDTGDMDEAVLRHDSGGFRHFRMPVSRLDPAKLPGGIALMLCDINLAPPEVLPHVQRLQRAIQAPRLILTVKLNTPVLETRVDEFIRFIQRFAPAPIHVTQLAANRREVCVTAGF